MMFEKFASEDPAQRAEQARYWRHLRARLHYLPSEVRSLVLSRWHSPRFKSTRKPMALNWLISNTLHLNMAREKASYIPKRMTPDVMCSVAC